MSASVDMQNLTPTHKRNQPSQIMAAKQNQPSTTPAETASPARSSEKNFVLLPPPPPHVKRHRGVSSTTASPQKANPQAMIQVAALQHIPKGVARPHIVPSACTSLQTNDPFYPQPPTQSANLQRVQPQTPNYAVDQAQAPPPNQTYSIQHPLPTPPFTKAPPQTPPYAVNQMETLPQTPPHAIGQGYFYPQASPKLAQDANFPSSINQTTQSSQVFAFPEEKQQPPVQLGEPHVEGNITGISQQSIPVYSLAEQSETVNQTVTPPVAYGTDAHEYSEYLPGAEEWLQGEIHHEPGYIEDPTGPLVIKDEDSKEMLYKKEQALSTEESSDGENMAHLTTDEEEEFLQN